MGTTKLSRGNELLTGIYRYLDLYLFCGNGVTKSFGQLHFCGTRTVSLRKEIIIISRANGIIIKIQKNVYIKENVLLLSSRECHKKLA